MQSQTPTAANAAAEELEKRARRRQIKDKLANLMIGAGGMFVIVAIALIFFYLLFEVWPLFESAKVEKDRRYASAPATGFVDLDEYNSTGIRLTPAGTLEYFNVGDGKGIGEARLPLPAGVSITSVQHGAVTGGLIGVGLSNGRVLVLRSNYSVDYDGEGSRHVTPAVSYPYGETPLPLDDSGKPVQVFALTGSDDKLRLLGVNGERLVWNDYSAKSEEGGDGSGLEDESSEEEGAPKTWERSKETTIPLGGQPRFVQIGQDSRWAYVFTGDSDVAVINLKGEDGPALYQQLHAGGARITSVAALQGNISLLVGDEAGRISQWFLVRDKESEIDKFSLTRIRSFTLGSAPITAIAPEPRRKGFVAGDEKGEVGVFYTTSERTLERLPVADGPVRGIGISPHSTGILVQSDKGSSFLGMHSEHPDISMSSLWGKVWYESYPEPGYTWQSTSGSSDFEGKLSLVPLTYGTLKAAFYAMLFAAPLAICGAMYTAVFMAPSLRRKVKPAIELMQALPTVILGFLAGLWLAPTIETNLPGIFSLLIVTPIIILLCGYGWSRLPQDVRLRLPDGWAPVLLIAPILIAGWVSFELSRPIELAFFGGDVRHWLGAEAGLRFDQRNALIVGLAMGFAVIAPIFSIAEDALFAVPRHLTNGSLALGATQWQTLIRVVLPTASPGIFSALMIGFGRAVGETMIVLMATGNTAVMDWNIFEGMRTLSANVAVEMGEAEVGSTHFRVLFLSALVLFVLTFIVNTIAEVVRTRLRKKYGSL
ncbi:MAG TPA: ABC transporter permease subunit [Moraxellaceae bacterium]